MEHRVWVGVGELARTFAIADEDLDRTDRDKTAAVHFLRFELDSDQVDAVRAGAGVTLGIDHDELRCEVTLDDGAVAELARDLGEIGGTR